MADSRVVLRIQVKGLDTHALGRWVRAVDDTLGHVSVPVVARRHQDGTVFLEAGGSVGTEEEE